MINEKDIDKQFLSSVITKARKSLGKTQEDFGKMFKPQAAKSIVSRWEKGKSVPSEDRLKLISNLTGYTVNELLYGSYEASIKNLIDFAMFLNFHEIKEEYDNASTEEKQFLNNAKILSNNLASSEKRKIIEPIMKKYFNKNTLKLDANENEIGKAINDNKNVAHSQMDKEANYIIVNTKKIAIAKGILPNDDNELIKIMIDTEKQYSSRTTDTNEGLLNLVYQNIEYTRDKVKSLIYTYNDHDKKYIRSSDDISKNVEKDINKVLDNSIKELKEISKRNNINLDFQIDFLYKND